MRRVPAEATALAFGAIVLLLLGAVITWWRLIDAPEPVYVTAIRLCILAPLGLACYSVCYKRGNAAHLAIAGAGSFLLSIGALCAIVFFDPRAVYLCSVYTTEADRLWAEISSTFYTPQLPWIEFRPIRAHSTMQVDYTFLDAFEMVSYFLKGGWYLSLLGSIAAIAAAAVWNRRDVANCFAHGRRRAGITLAILASCVAAPLYLSHYYLEQARNQYALGLYSDSQRDYQLALRFDPRLSYDTRYRFEIGVLEGRLGETDTPDYWASRAEIYLNSRMDDYAVAIYSEHISSLTSDPTLACRLSTILLRSGSGDYRDKRPGAALRKWNQALEMDPDNIEIRYDQAMAYADLGEYSHAVEEFKQVIALNEQVGLFHSKLFVCRMYRKPITAECWSRMGWCYFQMHQDSDADLCWANSKLIGATDPASVQND